MLRPARLDAPGVLHQVMGRGITRRRLVPDDPDRADFSGRLAALMTATGLTVYAWALRPHPAHLRVRTVSRPLAGSLACGPLGVSGCNLDGESRHSAKGFVKVYRI